MNIYNDWIMIVWVIGGLTVWSRYDGMGMIVEMYVMWCNGYMIDYVGQWFYL